MESLSAEEYVFDRKSGKYSICEGDVDDIKVSVDVPVGEVQYDFECNEDKDINVTVLKDSADGGLGVAVTLSDTKHSAEEGLGVAAASDMKDSAEGCFGVAEDSSDESNDGNDGHYLI